MGMWSVLSEDQKKRLMLIGGVGGLLIVGSALFLLLSGPSGPKDVEPELNDVRRLEKNRDAEGLAKIAEDPNPTKAAAAIQAMGSIGGPQAQQVAVRGMASPSPIVRGSAALTYGRTFDRTAPAAVKPVQDLVTKDPSPDVIIAALKALAVMKAWDSLDTVLDKMNHDDRAIRLAASRAFEDIAFLGVGSYRVDDPPEKRLKAIQGLRVTVKDPVKTARYHEWVKELKQKRQPNK